MDQLSQTIEYMLADLERTIMKEVFDDNDNIEELSIEDFNTITRNVFDTVYESCIYQTMEANYTTLWTQEITTELSNFIESLPDFLQKQVSPNITEYMVEHIYNIIQSNIVPRSLSDQNKILDISESTKKIKRLREINKILPKQRTNEWFKMRNEIISASSLWKVVHTESVYNNLIYEKCNGANYNYSSNIHSPLHWGQKYEPVAQLFYNYTFNTTIEEYGCIPHKTHTYLGASPDGLNVNENSNKYGRLVEIKCIKNREITGVPKKEYWIQMQSQMECCDIDMCDFLECRFLEYENYDNFEKDGTYTKTENGQLKGVILCFQDNNQQIIYRYKPVEYDKQKSKEWIDQIIHENSHLTYIHTYYWYLQEYSCVTLNRNKKWFELVLPKIKKMWDTIQYEKQNGYSHRASQKRKKTKVEIKTQEFDSKGKCLVNL